MGENLLNDHRVIERLIAGRQGLQREDLALLLRAYYGDAGGSGKTQQLVHRVRGEIVDGHPTHKTKKVVSSSIAPKAS